MTYLSDHLDEPPPYELNAGVSEFVESMGLLLERYGVPRIGGRIWGLMMLTEQPFSLDDFSRLLNVSRASVSTNLRLAERTGFAQQVSRPGDRRDYYKGVENAWDRAILADIQEMASMADIARHALSNVPPEDSVARRRLQEMIEFYAFYHDRLQTALNDWKNRPINNKDEKNE